MARTKARILALALLLIPVFVQAQDIDKGDVYANKVYAFDSLTVGDSNNTDVCIGFDIDWLPDPGPPIRNDPTFCFDYLDDKFSIGGLIIGELSDPIDPQDAATKAYVESAGGDEVWFGNTGTQSINGGPTPGGEQSIMPVSFAGGETITGGRVGAGDSVEFDAWGYYSTTNSTGGTKIRLRLKREKSGGIQTTVADSGLLQTLESVQVYGWHLKMVTTYFSCSPLPCADQSFTQTFLTWGTKTFAISDGSYTGENRANVTSHAINFGSQQTLRFTGEFSSSDGNDLLYVTNATMSIKDHP